MKQNKNIAPAELSYYGLYLLDYLRKYHPDKVIDIEFIGKATQLCPFWPRRIIPFG